MQRGTVSAAAQSYADALAGSADLAPADSSGTASWDGSPAAEDVFSAGLSGVALVALGIAAVAVLWMAAE